MVIVKYEYLVDRLDFDFLQNAAKILETSKKKALCVIGSEIGRAVTFEQTVFNAHTDKFSIEIGITDVKQNAKIKKEIKKLLKACIKDVDAIAKIEILLSTL